MGPSWLSCIQWNLSIVYTNGTQLSVQCRGVPNSEVDLYTALCGGTADSVLIREVSFIQSVHIERFHCTHVIENVQCICALPLCEVKCYCT